MQYNGLNDDLKSFAQFVYIYETNIKNMQGGLNEFSHKYSRAYNMFVKNKLNKKIKYATTKEIASLKDEKKYPFYMTKQRFQVWDMCRHLRNSFAHANLRVSGNTIVVTDKRLKRLTATGFLDYSSVKEFIVAIIKEYENK